jgi:hypothetical protein
MKQFTIEEIKNYLQQQDILGDVLYNLSEENITKANKTISFTLEEILHNGNDWEDFCDKYGVNEYAVNEGGGHVQKEIFVNDAKKYGLI